MQLFCLDYVRDDDQDDDANDGEDGFGSKAAGERADDEYCDRDGAGDHLLMSAILWSYAFLEAQHEGSSSTRATIDLSLKDEGER